MSTVYYQEIQHVVNQGLAELNEEQARGRVPKNPVSETHFIVRWVTKAIKTHRFDRCVVKDLMGWQQEGRSKGTSAGLKVRFEHISALYGRVVPVDSDVEKITQDEITALLAQFEDESWFVVTDHEISGKAKLFSDGDNSLVVCKAKLESVFDAGVLVKPLTCYVRGNHNEFLEMTAKAGLLVHKKSDYKSIVKYHGEYQIWPENQSSELAELPLSFMPSFK